MKVRKKLSLFLALFMLLNIVAMGLSVPVFAAPSGEDVSRHVNVTNLKIENQAEGNPTIDPNQSGGLKMSFDFTVADREVKAGDYFEIQLSDNMNFNGDIAAGQTPAPNFYNSVGALIAEGKYIKAENKFVYTFTDYVENSVNVKGHANYSLWVDREHVTMPGNQNFTVTAAGEKVSKTFYINFTNSPKLVDSFIPMSNPEDGTFTQVVYVNPKHDYLMNTKLTIRADHFYYDENQRKALCADTDSIAEIKDGEVSFIGYRIPKGTNFPASFGVDSNQFQKTDLVPRFFIGNDGVTYVEFNFVDNANDGSGFIVVMHGKTNGNDGGLRVAAKVDAAV